MKNAAPDNLWYYNKDLRCLAKKNRKEMTKAEACLWKYVLSKSQMKGYRFTRQRPVLNFIADFMCKELMLIIEVDGLTHQWEDVILNDVKREEALNKVGFTILRFDDDDVLNHIDNVFNQISDFIEDFEMIIASPPPLIPPPVQRTPSERATQCLIYTLKNKFPITAIPLHHAVPLWRGLGGGFSHIDFFNRLFFFGYIPLL